MSIIVSARIDFKKNNPNLKMLNTYRIASSRFAFSTIFQSRLTENIFCIC